MQVPLSSTGPALTQGAILPAFDRSKVVWLLLVLVIAVLVVYPLLELALESLSDPRTRELTLANYQNAFGIARHLEAIRNSLMLGATVAAISVVIAVPLAWAVSQTNMPGRSIVPLMVLSAFITPDYLNAISWILLAGPNAGWLNRGYMAITGSTGGAFNVYSFWGLAFVIAANTFPYVFIFTAAALRSVGSEMIDAARILGAGVVRTSFKITLPLVLPSIIAGAIVSFLEAVAIFGTPALIALPARYNVVSTQLWEFFNMPIQVEVAAAYSIPLLLMTATLFWLQKRITRRRGFVLQSGKGGSVKPIDLGLYRWALLAYSLFILVVIVVLPYLTLVQAAFSSAWGAGFRLDNLTLENFRTVLGHPDMARSMTNTLTYAVSTAVLALTLAALAAYVVVRRLLPFGDVLGLVCMAPFVIPGMVMAIGFYASYAPPPLALYGTSLIIILAFTVRFMPIAYANISAALRSINVELEDQVRILGGDRLVALRRVVVPLIKHSLFGAGVLVFIPSLRELSTAVFLTVESSRTVSVMIFDLSEQGRLETLSALGLLLLVFTISVVALTYRFVGRDFMRRGSAW